MAGRFQNLDPEKIKEALAARKSGATYEDLAAMLNCSKGTVERLLQRHGMTRKYKPRGPRSLPEAALDARLKQRAREMWFKVPADTRDLTARLMGDPLPGRSALDQLNSHWDPPV